MWASILSSIQFSLKRFTARAIKVLAISGRYAAQQGHPRVTPEHILLGLTNAERGPGRVTLERLVLELYQNATSIVALAEKAAAEDSQERKRLELVDPRLSKRQRLDLSPE